MNFLCGYRIKEYKNSTVSKGFIFGVCVCKGFYELLFICIAQQFTIFIKIGLHFLNNSRYFTHKEIVSVHKTLYKMYRKGPKLSLQYCQDEEKQNS